MKKSLMLVVLCIVVGISVNTHSAPQVSGKVKNLYVKSDGLVLFDLDACMAGGWDFKFRLDDPFAKEMYSFLLAAQSQNIDIIVGFWGACGSKGDPMPSPAYMAKKNI